MKGSSSIVALLAAVVVAVPTPATRDRTPYRFQQQSAKNGVNWILSPSETAPEGAPPMLIKFYRDDSKAKNTNGKSASFTLDIETPKKMASASSVSSGTACVNWSPFTDLVFLIAAIAMGRPKRQDNNSVRGYTRSPSATSARKR
jgi:hypothetical protein